MNILVTSSNTAGVVGAKKAELRPMYMSSVGTDLRNLFFVTFNTPEGTNIVSVDEAFGWLVIAQGRECESNAQTKFAGDVHSYPYIKLILFN